MKIIRSSDTVTKEWSGGTTTELAIWPEGAVYADRDFDWRLSSAEVNDEKSTFTALPDYIRFLTIRKGKLKLRHDGGEWYDLAAGDVAEFDGGSLTESEGKVTDFNLMLRKGRAEGRLEAGFLRNGGSLEAGPKSKGSLLAVYLSGGTKLHIEAGGDAAAELGEGDLLILGESDAAGTVTATAEGECMVICAHICSAKG